MENLQFLKRIPLLNSFTYRVLKSMVDKFKPIEKIRFAYLYREGDPAEYVYLVKSGEFKITKKLFFEVKNEHNEV